MFRRIECIHPHYRWRKTARVDEHGNSVWEIIPCNSCEDVKGGILFQGGDIALPKELRYEATDAWACMPGPHRRVSKGQFFFTEAGWEKYGRPTVNLMQTAGERYRIIKVKENAMEVMYKDEIQAVLRPKKRQRRGGRERIQDE